MKEYRLIIIILLISIMWLPVFAFASDYSDAEYSGVVRVSNNSTDALRVATVFTANTTAMIATGYMNESANNTTLVSAAAADIAYMPGYTPDGNPWCLWVDSIDGYTYLNDILYLGGPSDMAGKIRYFPDAEGMLIDDDASMEMSGNGTNALSSYLNLTTDKYSRIIEKENAYLVYKDDDNEISAITGEGLQDFTDYTEVDAPGAITVTATRITGEDVDTDFDAYVYDDFGAGYWDSINAQVIFYITSTTQNSGVGFMGYSDVIGDKTGWGNTDLLAGIYRSAGGDFTIALMRGNSIASDTYICSANTSYYCTLQRLAGNDNAYLYIYSDVARSTLVDTLTVAGYGTDTWQYGYGFVNNNSGAGGQNWDGYIDTLFEWEIKVTATSISSGEHDIYYGRDDPFNGLSIDTALELPVTDNLVMNAPLWQTDCSSSPFDTIDPNEFTATVSGATWALDEGYSFDGNDYIDCGTNVAELEQVTFSIVAWINPTTSADNKVIFSNFDNGGTVSGYLIAVRQNDDGTNPNKFYFVVANGDGTVSAHYGSAVTYGSWQMVAVTFNGGTNKVNAYQNTTQTITNATATTAPGYPGNNHAVIGALWNNAPSYDIPMLGSEGMVMFYDKALTSSEVTQIYNSTKSKYTSGDIYVYSMTTNITDTANPTIVGGASTPYIESFEVTKGGASVCEIEWEYSDTFTDLSGNSNDATPSFRGSSSDADVSAALLSFSPIAEADAPEYTLASAPDFLTTTPGVYGDFETGLTPTYPGRGVIYALAAAGGVPEQLPTLLIFTFILIVISFVVSAIFRSHGSGTLFIKSGIITAVMCIYVALGIYDVWQVYFFVIMALGLMWMERQREAY